MDYTVEALGKDLVSCKEIVPISEVKETSIHGRHVLSQRFPYHRLHETLSTIYYIIEFII